MEAAAVFRDGLAVLTPSGCLWCVWLGRALPWLARGRAQCRSGRAPLHALLAELTINGAAPWCLTGAADAKACMLTVHRMHPSARCRCVADVRQPRLQRLADPGIVPSGGAGSGVHCMAVVPPSVSSSGTVEVRGWQGTPRGSSCCVRQLQVACTCTAAAHMLQQHRRNPCVACVCRWWLLWRTLCGWLTPTRRCPPPCLRARSYGEPKVPYPSLALTALPSTHAIHLRRPGYCVLSPPCRASLILTPCGASRAGWR